MIKRILFTRDIFIINTITVRIPAVQIDCQQRAIQSRVQLLYYSPEYDGSADSRANIFLVLFRKELKPTGESHYGGRNWSPRRMDRGDASSPIIAI